MMTPIVRAPHPAWPIPIEPLEPRTLLTTLPLAPAAHPIQSAPPLHASLATGALDEAALLVAPHDFTVTEGLSTGLITLATWTDQTPGATAEDYTATINWGDDSAPALASISATETGGFAIRGQHTYRTGLDRTITIALDAPGVEPVSITVQATVNQIPIITTVARLGATQGVSTGLVSIASFTDANLLETADDFDAIIDFGDGSDLQTVGVVPAAPGVFLVKASHTYAHPGRYTISVTAEDVDFFTNTNINTAAVTNAPLSGTPVPVAATRGRGFEGIIAHFSDANTLATANSYSATLAYGDGQSGAGTIVESRLGGWDIIADHVYAAAGLFTLRTTLTDGDGATLRISSPVSVKNLKYLDYPLAGLAQPILATRSVRFSGVVATLTRPYPGYTPGDLVATIQWGDGQSSDATITRTASGNDTVNASHTWASAGSLTPTITISDVYARTLTLSTTATIRKPKGPGAAPLPSPATSLVGLPVLALRHHRFTTTLAHFEALNSNWVAGDFSFTIDWGDGTTSSATAIASDAGGFDVVARHRYAAKGSYAITTTLTLPDSSTLRAQSAAYARRPRHPFAL